MHKKLFTAVLALGLLLVALPAFAIDQTSEIPVKSFGGNQSKAGMTPTAQANPDPLVTVNSGQNRTVPGTFSAGDWQNPFAYSIGGWYAGDEFYAAYQDPATAAYWGAGGPVSNSPSFDVTAINTIYRFTAGPFPSTFGFQPLVFAPGPAGCTFDGVGPQPAPVAGGASCVGPLYGVTWTVAASFLINLPFPIECCQTGPFYAAYYAPTPGLLRPGCDDGFRDIDPVGPASGDECLIFNDYGAGWDELTGNYFCCFNLGPGRTVNALNHMLWSEGYTPDDPATHCNPGTCSDQFWFDDAAAPAFAFGLPSGSGGGRDALGVWIDNLGGRDTLTTVTFAMNGPAPAVPADITIEIWDGDDGVPVACSGKNPSFPGTLLYSETVPAGSIVWGGYTVWTLATPFVWGTLNGGPIERILVSLADYSAGTTNGLLANNDDAACDGTDRFMARYPALGNWLNIFDVSGIAPEPFIVLSVCQEVLPAQEADCGAGANDQWTSFAHDNRQSSASTLNVGDPNQVTIAWTRTLPRISNFTNPTVKGNIVYQSSDQELSAYNLIDGTSAGAAFSGGLEMGSSNRGNATVATIAALGRDVVFATGGSFNSITALETNLKSSPIIWSNNVVTFNPPNGLVQQNRFNTSKVVSVSGTDVLFVSTEPSAGTGLLYAFDAATGALYPGWGTNPLVLDAAAKHGPAVNAGKLYVATAIGGTNVSGSLYQIDAATGVVDWNFVGVAGEGWPSGVSTEGDFLYGASKDAANVGYRYKIDKSGALPAVVWTSTQGVGLYGTPTIGRGFVYFPLDNPSFGLLQVDKSLGLVARNFASENICGASPFMIPQIVTLSCDAYLFAGDRNARWWLMNAVSGELEWYRQFPLITGGEIVSGTALATYTVNGDDYAVVAVRQLNGTVGQLAAYKLNAGSRPRLIQCVTDVTISVPLNSGPGQPHSEPGALLNIGDAPLNFPSYSVSDPLPGLASIGRGVRQGNGYMASAARAFDGYSTIATNDVLTKHHRLSGLSGEMVDGEMPIMSAQRAASIEENLNATRNSSRASAASAAAIRTSAVTINGSGFPYALAAGGTGDLDWLFDGTGLGRGQDANDLELVNDDPDFTYNAINGAGTSTAVVHILYVGGCLNAEDTLDFGAANSEHVFNYGGLGFQARVDAFYFDTDPIDPETNLYDGGLMVLGDSLPGPVGVGGAQTRIQIYTNSSAGHNGHFVANVAPASIACGFDHYENIPLGARRTGGCPGTPVEIRGEIITHSMSDTDQTATPGSRLAAIGLDIVQTEVGAYDPLYGDFKLIQWEVINRDAVAKGPIYIGSWCDWDVVANYAANIGNFSAAANGYYIWDATTPGNSYGALDPSQRSTYSGIQPITPAKRNVIHHNGNRQGGAWPAQNLETVWSETVNETPAYGVDAPASGSDKAGLLINGAMNFAANGTEKRYHAFYGVDASSNADATIAANVLALAKRAARWGGFARGDVNDDGLVDLADVCWIQGGNPLYPAAYSGDVDADGDNDAADIARLLSFVSGNAGDQPAGAWRF